MCFCGMKLLYWSNSVNHTKLPSTLIINDKLLSLKEIMMVEKAHKSSVIQVLCVIVFVQQDKRSDVMLTARRIETTVDPYVVKEDVSSVCLSH